MIPYMQHLDWRVVLLALFIFYFLPSLVIRELLASLTDESAFSAHIGRPAASFLAFFYLVLPPAIAGRFAARYSRRLPIMTTVVLTLLGALLISFSAAVSAETVSIYAFFCISLGVAAAHFQLKCRRI